MQEFAKHVWIIEPPQAELQIEIEARAHRDGPPDITLKLSGLHFPLTGARALDLAYGLRKAVQYTKGTYRGQENNEGQSHGQ